MTTGPQPVPAIILGGTGYVSGELLRLLAAHPLLPVAAIASESQAGEPVEAAFPHLTGAYSGVVFSDRERLERALVEAPRTALFCAAPHGAAAPWIDRLLEIGEKAGVELRVVDISADFRFASPEAYAAVYKHEHGAPGRLADFASALPEHYEGPVPRHVGHPGCFTTATLLAVVPLLKLGLVEPRISVVGVTGSTGAGRAPIATTHHPARRSTLYAYNPLSHRHQPEMRALAQSASGVEAEIFFVPQAGPFARGIHATVTAHLKTPSTKAEVLAALRGFYSGARFIDLLDEPPKLQDVVGTNRGRLSVAVDGDHLVVLSTIDNLVKGAAGGAVQWMNRLLGFPEELGLTQPGLGWL